jgi:DnaA family protein
VSQLPSLPRQIALDLGHTPKPTLDNFIATGNENLISVLKNIQSRWQNPKDKSALTATLSTDSKMIHLWGASGSGRTHLLSALQLQASELGIHAFFLNHDSSMDEWRACADVLIENNQAPGLLCVDDIDHLSEFAQGALFRLHNLIREASHQHLITTSLAPSSNLQIREDLNTRLVWGLVFQMHTLSDSEKLQALQQAATERGLQISNEVAPWLLKHFHRDMPSLMSLLEALDNYSLETKRAITLPLLKEMLAQKN